MKATVKRKKIIEMQKAGRQVLAARGKDIPIVLDKRQLSDRGWIRYGNEWSSRTDKH